MLHDYSVLAGVRRAVPCVIPMFEEFTKAVFDHTDELHSISKVSDATELETATKWLMEGYPVHPGSARYFKEKGVWRDDLTIGKR